MTKRAWCGASNGNNGRPFGQYRSKLVLLGELLFPARSNPTIVELGRCLEKVAGGGHRDRGRTSILLLTEATLTEMPEPGLRLHKRRSETRRISSSMLRVRKVFVKLEHRPDHCRIQTQYGAPIGTNRFSHAILARIEFGLKAGSNMKAVGLAS